jgi:transposase InsO family protein
MTGYKRAPVCRALGISRATAYRGLSPRGRRYTKGDDRVVRARIRRVIKTRGSYGYRRVTALVNRDYGAGYNRKRIRRVMELNAWTLPRASKRTMGRAHTGRVRRAASDERWCSDTLEVPCWNGEVVEIGFALDCADREWLAYVAEPRALCGGRYSRAHHGGRARPLRDATSSGAAPVAVGQRRDLHCTRDGDPGRAVGAHPGDDAGV